MVKEFSILDAFRALSDLEEVEISPKPLKEGRTAALGDDKQLEDAKEFMRESGKDADSELMVIDVDADSLDHVKNDEEYIGQIILQCNACKALRYIAEDKLVASENDPTVFNPEDECPHCHALNSGYALVGQVGRVAKEEVVDAEDKAEDEEEVETEFSFTQEEEPEEPQAEEEEKPAEEEEEEVFVEEPESEEVPEDDTADMESTLGNEVDSDSTAKDDTEPEEGEEPKEEDEEAKKAAKLAGLIDDLEAEKEEKEKKAKAKKEALGLDQAVEYLKSKGISFDNLNEERVTKYAYTLLEEEADFPAEAGDDSNHYLSETLDTIAWKVNEYRKDLQKNESWVKIDFQPQSPEEELAKEIILANKMDPNKALEPGEPEYWILMEIVDGNVDDDTYFKYVYHLDPELKDRFAELAHYDVAQADFDYDRNLIQQAEDLVDAPEMQDEVEEAFEEAPSKSQLKNDLEEIRQEAEQLFIEEAKEESSDPKASEAAEPLNKNPLEESTNNDAKKQFFDEIIEHVDYLEDDEKDNFDLDDYAYTTWVEGDIEIPASWCRSHGYDPDNIDEQGVEEYFEEVIWKEPFISKLRKEVERHIGKHKEEDQEEEMDIDIDSINELLTSKLQESGNEGATFEATKGSFDNHSMLIEGLIKSEGLEVPVQFRFEPTGESKTQITNSLSDEVYTIEM